MNKPDRPNGYVRWWQLVSSFLVLLGISVTLLVWAANKMDNVSDKSNEEDKDIRKEVHDYQEKTYRALSSIQADIREIKTRLEIREDEESRAWFMDEPTVRRPQ